MTILSLTGPSLPFRERQKAVVVGLFSETVGSMWKTEVGLDEKGLSYRGAFVLFVVWINETLCPDPEPKAQSRLVTSPSFMQIYHYALTSPNMVASFSLFKTQMAKYLLL